MMPMIDETARSRQDPVVISFPEELDLSNTDAVSERLASAIIPELPVLIADMTRTTFCDSPGVRMLVRIRRLAARNGTELRLAGPGPGVLRVLELTGLDQLLPVYPSLAEALPGTPEADATQGGGSGQAAHPDPLSQPPVR
jgi:anti-sigma B factor antagonist